MWWVRTTIIPKMTKQTNIFGRRKRIHTYWTFIGLVVELCSHAMWWALLFLPFGERINNAQRSYKRKINLTDGPRLKVLELGCEPMPDSRAGSFFHKPSYPAKIKTYRNWKVEGKTISPSLFIDREQNQTAQECRSAKTGISFSGSLLRTFFASQVETVPRSKIAHHKCCRSQDNVAKTGHGCSNAGVVSGLQEAASAEQCVQTHLQRYAKGW